MNANPDANRRLMWGIVVGLALTTSILYMIEVMGTNRNPPSQTVTKIYCELELPNSTPKVYILREGATIRELLNIAGINGVNDSRMDIQLRTGDSVKILPDNKIMLGLMSGEKRLALGLPIPLNSAHLPDIIAIPNVGEATAIRIIKERIAKGRFSGYKELEEIEGITRTQIESIRKYTFVE